MESIKADLGESDNPTDLTESMSSSSDSESSDEELDSASSNGETKFNGSFNKSHQCEQCGKSFKLRSSYLVHMDKHKGKRYVCKTCGRSYAAGYMLRLHEKTHDENCPHTCTVCGKRFPTRYKVNRHEAIHKDKSKLSENNKSAVPNGLPGQLPVESLKAGTTSAQHTHANTQKSLGCKICGKFFASQNGLRLHIEKHRGKKYTCNLCDKSYTAWENLNFHMMRHENLKPWKCHQCEAKFLRKCQLKRHQKVHSKDEPKDIKSDCPNPSVSNNVEIPASAEEAVAGGDKQAVAIVTAKENKLFVCKICKKMFQRQNSLRVHFNKHLGKKFQCSACSKSFTSSDGLKTHKLTHENVKSWVCGTCGSQFRRKFHLMRHEKTHFPQKKDRICETCGKGFYTLEGLNCHLKVHSDVRPYQCTICGQTFKYAISLKQHNQLHEPNSREFKCNICTRAFHQKKTLKHHMEHHKGQVARNKGFLVPPVEHCDLCGLGLSSKRGLQRHLKKHREGTLKHFNKKNNREFTASKLSMNTAVARGTVEVRSDIVNDKLTASVHYDVINTENDAEIRNTENDAEIRNTENDAEIRNTERNAEIRNTESNAEIRNTENDAEFRKPVHGIGSGCVKNKRVPKISSPVGGTWQDFVMKSTNDMATKIDSHLSDDPDESKSRLVNKHMTTNSNKRPWLRELLTKQPESIVRDKVESNISLLNEAVEHRDSKHTVSLCNGSPDKHREKITVTITNRTSAMPGSMTEHSMTEHSRLIIKTGEGDVVQVYQNPVRENVVKIEDHSPGCTIAGDTLNKEIDDPICDSDKASESGELFIHSDYDSEATDIIDNLSELENNHWISTNETKFDIDANTIAPASITNSSSLDLKQQSNSNTLATVIDKIVTNCIKENEVKEYDSEATDIVENLSDLENKDWINSSETSFDMDANTTAPTSTTNSTSLESEQQRNYSTLATVIDKVVTNCIKEKKVKEETKEDVNDDVICMKNTYNETSEGTTQIGNKCLKKPRSKAHKNSEDNETFSDSLSSSPARHQVTNTGALTVQDKRSKSLVRTKQGNKQRTLIKHCKTRVRKSSSDILTNLTESNVKRDNNSESNVKRVNNSESNVKRVDNSESNVKRDDNSESNVNNSESNVKHVNNSESSVKHVSNSVESFPNSSDSEKNQNYVEMIINTKLAADDNDGNTDADNDIVRAKDTCDICNKVFKIHSYLRKHMRNFHPDKTLVYTCIKDGCSETFTSLTPYRHHLTSHAGVHCKLCGKTCKGTNVLITHIERQHDSIGVKKGDRVACMFCNELFEDRVDAEEHLRSHRVVRKNMNVSDEGSLKCDHCSKTFVTLLSLKQHLKIHGGGQTSMCERCGRVFTREAHLNRHKQSNACSRNHECLKCGQKFHLAGQLNVHMKSEHMERVYKCTLCDKVFATSSGLHRHKRFHVDGTSEVQELKLYMCSLCGKCYSASHSLKNHMVSHAGVRPHQCDTCGNTYKQRAHLLRHVAIFHKGIRKFKCEAPGCGKAFPDRRALNTHARVHTREKPYRCSECDKSFSQSQILNVHLKTHHVLKDHECPHCKQKFSTKMSMLRHMKRHASSVENRLVTGVKMKRRKVTQMANKQFQCDLCKQSFTTRRAALNHIRKYCPGKKARVKEEARFENVHIAAEEEDMPEFVVENVANEPPAFNRGSRNTMVSEPLFSAECVNQTPLVTIPLPQIAPSTQSLVQRTQSVALHTIDRSGISVNNGSMSSFGVANSNLRQLENVPFTGMVQIRNCGSHADISAGVETAVTDINTQAIAVTEQPIVNPEFIAPIINLSHLAHLQFLGMMHGGQYPGHYQQ